MSNQYGVITLMGSGELTATMVEVHKTLLDRQGAAVRPVFIDTPAGFQLNVDHLSRRALDYFQNRVGHTLAIASLKSADTGDGAQREAAYRLLHQANYILIGPGSPTYALRQWRQMPVASLIAGRIRQGACLVAASAAALTVGRFTLPVYEIYKVGQAPYWEEGLNLLGLFGLDCVVLPHWNNAEGGNHDTRFCFMGAPRLAVLEALLPPSTTLLGLDEHTALVIDLAGSRAAIRGIGQVTVRRDGVERVFRKGDALPLALLRGAPLSTEAGQRSTPAVADGPAPPLSADDVWDPLNALAEKIQSQLERNQVETATKALLTLERHIWEQQAILQERSAMGAAREVLRDMLALMGAHLGARQPADRRAFLAPLVEPLLEWRAALRAQHQWETADALRECLQQGGVTVVDTPDGVAWEVVGG
ncbi:hypothetical protein [Desulfatitalea alkaliphila]|uniref:Cysteinyl-tRNA synthetase n=1 Tax=Desulfatitalea alkaliphila TaxID=2929485 RepID=A0AA41UJ94_9BACT|nr:hypothetical protein [Desulfatitalea alkaliphila]MCJ8500909.1 hypothetical protein [Desulfatitalea alkaliphila]